MSVGPLARSWVVALLFAASCALVARYSDAWLIRTPALGVEGYPHLIEGEQLLEHLPVERKRIGRLADGVRLYENTDLDFHSAIPEDGEQPLYVVARAQPLDGVWPQLALYVDRELHAGFFVTSREWGLYRIDLRLSAGSHGFKLSYANDDSRYPLSRDLDLRLVALGRPFDLEQRFPRWRAASTIAPERFSRQRFAAAAPDGMRLWPGGEIEDRVAFPVAGTIPVEISASLPDGESAGLELSVDGRAVEVLEIRGTTATTYAATIHVSAGSHRIGLANRARPVRSGRDDSAPARDIALHGLRIGSAPPFAPPAAPLALTTGRHAVPADQFDLDSGSGQVDGERVLWTNGYLGRSVSVSRFTKVELTISARGESCAGEAPRMLVLDGDDQLAAVAVEAPDFRPYPVALTLDPGTHEILLVFDNDTRIAGECDRNLHVRGFELDVSAPSPDGALVRAADEADAEEGS